MDETACAVRKEHWNETIAAEIKEYVSSGIYPADMPAHQRSNFGKRARNFAVHDNHLFYKNKVDGSLRLAISSQAEKERVFKVCLHTIVVVEVIYEQI